MCLFSLYQQLHKIHLNINSIFGHFVSYANSLIVMSVRLDWIKARQISKSHCDKKNFLKGCPTKKLFFFVVDHWIVGSLSECHEVLFSNVS